MISTGKEAFKAANMTGKLIVFHHNLPVAPAPGQLKNRDDRKSLGTDKEKTVLLPQTKFYNDLGQECVAVGCSVDLFLFNNAYIDIATLSQVGLIILNILISGGLGIYELLNFFVRCLG